jgi:hypothetical protein
MIETPPTPGAPQRSPDGLWEWNGSQWIPAQPAPGLQKVAEPTPLVEAAPLAITAPPAQTNPISPDGKNQWNGTAWIPLKKKGHLVRNIGIVVGALILVGIGAAIASPGASNNNSPTSTTATSPAPSKAAASPTINQQHQLVVAYSTAAGQTGPLVDAFTAVGTDCGSDIAACRADLQSIIKAITTYESGLNKVQVPACLQQADRDLRLGMALIKQGAQQAINGIDATDASQINAGTALLDQGTSSINTATSEVKSANCP